MTWEIIPADKLSNEEYQELEAVSGSGLATIYKKSPAHYKYQPKTTTKALQFGIAAHAVILEPELFDAEFVRDVDAEQYPDALVTQNDMKAWLKDKGQKVSGTKPELVGRILDLEPGTHILDKIREDFAADNESKTIMKPEDYDAVQSMRNVVMQDDLMAEMLKGGTAEVSLAGQLMGVQVKSRPDLITTAGGIVQYKTTLDCNPVEFGRKIDNYGYLLKAAMEVECFTAAYGQAPAYYIWLAQEKAEPYVWKAYSLSEDALAIGRVQLDSALKVYQRCKDNNQWPAYGVDVEPILLPEWLTKQYGL